ncbi:MAG: FecCD family ABC transporter permease [Actinomycetota bacterium]
MVLALVVVVVASVAAGVAWGSVALSPADVGGIVWSRLAGRSGVPWWTAGQEQIVWELRLPRVLMAAVVGATLTTVGVAIQALVRNALADPFILGVSSGASVGAATVLLFGTFSSLGMYALATGGFLGALLAVVAVFLVAQEGGRLTPVRLVLAGVSMAFVFEAATSFLIFRADPRASQTVLFWLLGSFGRSSWRLLPLPAAILVAGFAYFLARARSLNALALGDDTALTLGVDVARLRRSLFLVAGWSE